LALKRELSYFDLMNIVIGAIVGSDIYIVPGLTAGLIGPFAIAIWILGGALSMVLVMAFAYCSYYVPNVGGSYAYVTTAFDRFYGFIAGWSMTIAEVVALPVFSIVFTNYLVYFIPLSYGIQLLVRVVFISAAVFVNIYGVKAAGRLNDVLTIAKLFPLLMIIVLGLGAIGFNPHLISNYSPFAPVGLGSFGTVIVLIFWAYAGFELGSLPASEVVDPRKNVPRALISGMAIVIFFYVMTNVAAFGAVNWAVLSASSVPLVLVATALLGGAGAVITGVGALASVSGVDETEVLGTARLMYAMAQDGLLPKAVQRIHPRYGTPYVAVLIQGAVALALSFYSQITQLISFAVFNLGICYLLVCLSLSVLKQDGSRGLRGQSVIPWMGVAVSLYLLYSTSLSSIAIGTIVVLLGLPIYFFYARVQIRELKTILVSEEEVLMRSLERQNKPLARLVVWVKYRLKKKGGSARR
jgi:amino acid transporter